MMLSVSTGFDPTGTLVLLGGIFIALMLYNLKKEKTYKAAMAEYEQAIQKLEQAAAARASAVAPGRAAAAPNGLDPETVAIVSAAAVVAAEMLQNAAVSGGEVLLTGVDEPTAALLLAIVAKTVGGDPAVLRFRSIRAL
ncbi:MAG: hypothetical protein RR320_06935 [Oscillospiraceae bacterium]